MLTLCISAFEVMISLMIALGMIRIMASWNLMTRTPQSVELLSLEEIAAIKQQLIETTKLLEDAEKLASEKELEGLMVLYKTGLLRVEASLRRLHSSLYQSISKTRLGQEVSISDKAKRLASKGRHKTTSKDSKKRSSKA